MNSDITGIVLSGGKGSRMGNDKGMMLYRGQELVKYSISLLQHFCATIIISSNREDLYSKFGYKVVHDIYKEIGPIGGIYSVLKESKTEKNLILSCDIPLLSEELFDEILLNVHGHDIVVPKHSNGHLEPLAGYYSKDIIPSIEELIRNKDYKMINLINTSNAGFVEVEKLNNGSSQFRNINTPQDLLT
jgi:molybdopterin-guanine dinucleotide biosynthesis protein A